jgi:uncharacterized membrane protein YidH (DUF202 family)
MSLTNSFQKLGKTFRYYGIFTIVYVIFVLLDTYVYPTGISSILAIIDLVFQIFIIVYAKQAARMFNQAGLNKFANYLILALVVTFVSAVAAGIETFQIALSEYSGGSSVNINLTPTLVTISVIAIITVCIELAAWYAMSDYFKNIEAVDMQVRGTSAVKLAIIAYYLALVQAVAVDFPQAFQNSTTTSLNLFSILDIPFDIVVNVLVVAAYLKLAPIFSDFGVFFQQNPIQVQGMPFPPGMPPSGFTLPGDASTKNQSGMPATFCPSCGKGVPERDPPWLFCPSCGSKL